MSLDAVKNFSVGELSSGVNATGTAFALKTGQGSKFPDPATDGAFNAVIYDAATYARADQDPNVEIVRVTSKSGDNLTVERAQEGTSATDHAADALIFLSMTAKMITDISSQLSPTGTEYFSGSSGTGTEENAGQMGASSTSASGSESYIYFWKITTSINGGTLKKFNIWNGNTVPTNVKCALYTDSGDSPGSLIPNSESEILTGLSSGINIFNVANGATLSASASYWVAVQTEGPDNWARNAPSGSAFNIKYVANDYANGFPSSISGTSTIPSGESQVYITIEHGGTGQTDFNLTSSDATQDVSIITVNNSVKIAGSDYTIANQILSFTEAPPTGTNNIKVVWPIVASAAEWSLIQELDCADFGASTIDDITLSLPEVYKRFRLDFFNVGASASNSSVNLMLQENGTARTFYFYINRFYSVTSAIENASTTSLSLQWGQNIEATKHGLSGRIDFSRYLGDTPYDIQFIGDLHFSQASAISDNRVLVSGWVNATAIDEIRLTSNYHFERGIIRLYGSN